LVYGKNYRTPSYFIVKTMVSGEDFSIDHPAGQHPWKLSLGALQVLLNGAIPRAGSPL